MSGTGSSRPATPAQVERERRQRERQRAQDRVIARQKEAESRTAKLGRRVGELRAILETGAGRSARIDLAARRRVPMVPALELGPDGRPANPPDWGAFEPPAPGMLSRVFGGDRRYALDLSDARERFEAAQQEHAASEAERRARVSELEALHQAAVESARAEAARFNADLDTWITGVRERRHEDVERYLAEILAATPLPRRLPRNAEVTFDAENEHAVVRLQLPGIDVVPTMREIAYVKSRDEFVEKPRPARECADLYRSVISQVGLLAIRDLFDGDTALAKISFNGHVSRTHPATGQPDYPCLLSLVVEREEFGKLVLNRVEPEECLRHLKALVSSHPYEVEAVRPLVDFDRSRYAFTQSVDVVVGLDHRDDLMRLTPTEFEHLVRQLFEATPGMQGWTTQASKDDGIDAVIFNATPITGGLTVVQAKQYSMTVGVQHVRELRGAMEDKKAGRGVLVTTSTFTKDARILAARFGGQVQLIDGPELVFLMKEHLDKDVVIGRRAKKSS